MGLIPSNELVGNFFFLIINYPWATFVSLAVYIGCIMVFIYVVDLFSKLLKNFHENLPYIIGSGLFAFYLSFGGVGAFLEAMFFSDNVVNISAGDMIACIILSLMDLVAILLCLGFIWDTINERKEKKENTVEEEQKRENEDRRRSIRCYREGYCEGFQYLHENDGKYDSENVNAENAYKAHRSSDKPKEKEEAYKEGFLAGINDYCGKFGEYIIDWRDIKSDAWLECHGFIDGFRYIVKEVQKGIEVEYVHFPEPR